jgi:sugar phosphate isomerase/epimerase
MPVLLSRRSLLAAPMAVTTMKSAPLSTIGLQLYTLRNILPKDPDGILGKVAAMGYREVEAVQGTWTEVAASVAKHGLKVPSMHLDSWVVTERWPKDRKPISLEDAASTVKSSGAQWAMMPYVDQADRGGADVFRALADKMNRAAESLKKMGLGFCYHHHAFEFAPVDGQKTGMDIFMERFDPNLVMLEVDIFWLKIAGQDPAAFLSRHKGRVKFLHVKDVAPGAPVQFSERVAPPVFKEIGAGTLDVPAILKAAQAAGVEHFIVEQDQCPGDPLESVKKSIDYLKAVSL